LETTDIFVVTAYVSERILLLAQENRHIKIVLAGGVHTQLEELADALGDRIVRI
jgi:nickel-dependent lactate racemase